MLCIYYTTLAVKFQPSCRKHQGNGFLFLAHYQSIHFSLSGSTVQIVKQGLLPDQDISAFPFTRADVMHLSLRYQFTDGMLRQSLYSLGAFLNGEHFHGLNFLLLLGRLILHQFSQQVENLVDDLLVVSFHFTFLLSIRYVITAFNSSL